MRVMKQGQHVRAVLGVALAVLLLWPASASAQGGPPPWWNTNWAYRQKLSIGHSLGGDLPAGATVRAPLAHADLVSAGHAKPGGEDVRVLYRDPGTGAWHELDRVAEPGTNGWNASSPEKTHVWFQVQAPIPPGVSNEDYYVYYGNPAATSPPENRANVYQVGTVSWNTTGQWSAAGASFDQTQPVNDTVQLAPIEQAPRLPNSPDTLAYEYKSGGGGYVPSGAADPNMPPPFNDALSWAPVTDPTKLASASSMGGTVWETRVTNGRNQWDWIKVKFHLTDTRLHTLKATWKGWGDPDLGYYEYLYLLNPANNTWEQVRFGEFRSSPGGTLEIQLSDDLARSYVDEDGDVWVAVGAKHSNYAPYAVTLNPVPDPGNGSTTASLSWKLPSPKDPDLSDTVTYKLYWKKSGESWSDTRAVDVTGATSYLLNVGAGQYATWNWKISASDGAKTQDSATSSFTTWQDKGSCPFVYYWDGEKYKYVTDIQGTTIGPRVADTAPYITPMLIPLAGFAPSDSKYNVRLREVLNEVTYFDQARLWLVDHPAGYEIVSATSEFLRDFKMKPAVRLWAVRSDARAPIVAVNHKGEDILDRVRSLDNQPVPVDVATDNYYVFDFGKIEHPEYAKLVIDGWSFNPKSSGGAAVGRPLLPWLETIGSDGQWHRVRHAGMPAGDLKTVVYDLANQFPTDDHRIRLNGVGYRIQTMVIDRVRLDDSPLVPLKVVEVNPDRARLFHRGAVSNTTINLMTRIQAQDDVVPDIQSWYYDGAFTKYGDVLPLVTQADDRYVIMRHADALDLEFPANLALPAPGLVRTPVLYADMWYKRGGDGDTSIYPLPFHGMTRYPYTDPERYPDDLVHQEYLKEWNTRLYTLEPNANNTTGSDQTGATGTPATTDTDKHSLNTDYLALTYSQFVSPATYQTPGTALGFSEQITAVLVDYDAVTPAGTSAAAEVTVDGGTSWLSVGDGETKSYAPDSDNNELRFKFTFTTSDPLVTPELRSLSATYYSRVAYPQEPLVLVDETVETPEIAPVAVVLTPLDVTPAAAQGATNAVVGKLSLAVTSDVAALNGLTLSLAGNGPENQVTAVKLWKAMADGSFSSDPGQLLATGAFSSGEVTLNPVGPPAVTESPLTLYVTFDFSPTATIGATFGVAIASANAVDMAVSEKISQTGFPVAWPTLTLARAPKDVTVVGQSLAPASVLAGLHNVPVLRFQPSVASDDTVLQAVTVTLTGTGPLSDVSRVKLWRDAPSSADGSFSPSADLLLASAAPPGATVTLRPALQTIAASDQSWFYVTVDTGKDAAPGGTHAVSLADESALSFTRGDLATGAFPLGSDDFTLQASGADLPAQSGTSLTIDPGFDADAGQSGVQTGLTGSSAAPVTVTVTNGSYTRTYDATPTGGIWRLVVEWRPGVNQVDVSGGGTMEVNLIDPFGVVYDAATGRPVPGATVTLRRAADDMVVGEQPTDDAGYYSFLAPAGEYRLTVQATGFDPVPPGSQMVTVPAGNGLGTTPGSEDGVYKDIYYGAPFAVEAAPLHFDVPLDPTNFSALVLTKTVDRPSVTVGDVVTYRLRLRNTQSNPLAGLPLVDVLPQGLRYVEHSAVIQGQSGIDPVLDGQALTFTLPELPAGGEIWVSYRAVVSASAAPGDYVNRAVAQRPGSSAALSNIATATVRVVKDAFFQLSTILGRVYVDANGNGFPDDGEEGLAGVRIVADDGTAITTDTFGRFHLGGLSVPSKALKLDPSSLPAGAVPITPNSRVVTLRPGLPAEASFGVLLNGGGTSEPPQGFHLMSAEATFTAEGMDGRLAGYLRRDLGSYRLEASYDSSREKSRQSADETEQGYSTYGDRSVTDGSGAASSSPLYLSLRGTGVEARYGDFKLPVEDRNGPEGTGATLALQAGATAEGKAARSLQVYAGNLSYPKVRDELRAQDGSLYHLSHRPVVSGTERVWLEARDQFTGQVVASADFVRGRDYEVDLVGGRIITREMVPSTTRSGSLLGQPVGLDHLVYVMVDFQYDAGPTFAPGVFGGRGEVQVGTESRLGVSLTGADDGQSVATLFDLSGKAGPLDKYRLEFGSGRAVEVAKYVSEDGGVTFQPAPAPGGVGTKRLVEAAVDLGRLAKPAADELAAAAARTNGPVTPSRRLQGKGASPLQAKVAEDLSKVFKPEDVAVGLKTENSLAQPLTLLSTGQLAGEIDRQGGIAPGWWRQEGALVLEGSLKETTSGFASGSEPATPDQEELAYKLTAKPAAGTTVTVESSATHTAANSSQKVTGQVRMADGPAALTVEMGEARSATAGNPWEADRSLAAKYEYRVTQHLTLSAGRRIHGQHDLSVNMLGASAMLGRTTAQAEYSYGEREQSGRAALAYAPLEGARLYANWEGGERDGASLNRLTLGGSNELNERTRLFVERKLDADAAGVAASDAAGVEFSAAEKVGISFAYGQGQAANGSERTSGSASLTYRDADRLQGSAALEVASQADGRQEQALKGKVELGLNPAVTLVGRALVSQVSGAGYTGGNVTEVAVGTAYRPMTGDRLNLLSQVTLRSENGDASGTGGDGTAVRSLVLSTEGLYRIHRAWRLGGKVAWKRAAAGEEGTAVDTLLVANRLLYQVRPGIELAGEYRLVKQGQETASGPVLELDFAFPGTDSVWLGLGYNYAGFSDSLLGDTEEAGWFLRIRGLL